jgi:integrase
MACITKRRDRYVIDCYDQHGKRYRKALKKGTTKDAARKALRETEDRIARRTFMHEKKTPFFSEVSKKWLEHKKQYLRETTQEVYELNVTTHLKELDGFRISEITTADIERFITKLQMKCRSTKKRKKKNPEQGAREPAPEGKKIALGTVRKIITILGQIMAYAVRHRMIDFNPVHDAERPRSQGRVDQKKIIVLNPDEIRTFLDKVEEQKYRTLFLAAIMTGARQGEILGMKWSDVDFQKKQVHICRTFNHGRFFTPKTHGSDRKIDLSPIVIKELATWKLASKATELESRKKHEAENKPVKGNVLDLVFPNEEWEPMNYSNMVQRFFQKAIRAANIPRIRFHDLRHTYASLLLSQGENIKYIQTQLGHSSPMVTLNVYSHLLKDSNQEAACRLESTIFQSTGHNLVTITEKGLTVNG